MMEQEPPGAADRPETAAEPAAPAEVGAQSVETPAVETPAPPPPVVPWSPPPPSDGWSPDRVPPDSLPPEFSIGAVLSDAFARYAADPIRIFAVGLVPAIVGLAASTLVMGSQVPDLSSIGSWIGSVALLTVVGVAVGLISVATTFALLEVGRGGSLGNAARWGLSRFGWLLATAILVALAVGGIYLVSALLVVLVFRFLGPLAFIPILIAFVLVLWAAMRLYLAVVAVVVDRIDAAHAIRLAWSSTRRTGVWLRLLGCFIVLGLAIGPVSFLASWIAVMGVMPPIVASVVAGLLLALVSPLATTLVYSAYRRLVRSGASVAGAAPAGFVPPPFGTRGRAFVGVTILLAIAGLVSAPFTISSMFSRFNFPTGPTTRVPAGTVAFGSFAFLRTCTALGTFTSMPADGSMMWIAAFTNRTKPSDSIRLVIKVNGVEGLNETEPSGAFDCLGSNAPETGLESGTYDFSVYVNGAVSAHGTLVVHP